MTAHITASLDDACLAAWVARFGRCRPTRRALNDNIVGSQLRLSSQPKYRLLGLTFQALAGALVNGDALALVMWLPCKDGQWPTRLQVIEADRLATPPWLVKDKTVCGGVKIDNYGAPLGQMRIADRSHWTFVPASGPVIKSPLTFGKTTAPP
jgi:hypothetical protein